MDNSSLVVINETTINPDIEIEELNVLVSLVQIEEKCSFASIEYVFVDEDKIVEINTTYLSKDYVTDIITFRVDDINEAEPYENIEGSICICLPRVIEQAAEFKTTYKEELLRVCVHGLLHLSGYEDGNDTEKNTMRNKENYYINKMNPM